LKPGRSGAAAMKQLEGDDPMTITAAPIPDEAGEVVRDMAVCIAEEYLGMGCPADTVMSFFADPEYRLPHQAYRSLGPVGTLQAIRTASRRQRRRVV